MKSKIHYSYRVPFAGCINPSTSMQQLKPASQTLPFPTLQDFINYKFIKQKIKT